MRARTERREVSLLSRTTGRRHRGEYEVACVWRDEGGISWRGRVPRRELNLKMNLQGPSLTAEGTSHPPRTTCQCDRLADDVH